MACFLSPVLRPVLPPPLPGVRLAALHALGRPSGMAVDRHRGSSECQQWNIQADGVVVEVPLAGDIRPHGLAGIATLEDGKGSLLVKILLGDAPADPGHGLLAADFDSVHGGRGLDLAGSGDGGGGIALGRRDLVRMGQCEGE